MYTHMTVTDRHTYFYVSQAVHITALSSLKQKTMRIPQIKRFLIVITAVVPLSCFSSGRDEPFYIKPIE